MERSGYYDGRGKRDFIVSEKSLKDSKDRKCKTRIKQEMEKVSTRSISAYSDMKKVVTDGSDEGRNNGQSNGRISGNTLSYSRELKLEK